MLSVRVTFGIILSLLIFLTQIAYATASEPKGHGPAKGGSKKAKIKSKVAKTAAKPAKASASNRKKASPVRTASAARAGKRGAHAKRKAGVRKVAHIRRPAPVLSAGDLAGLNRIRDPLRLNSNVALAFDESNSEILFEKNSDVALPIASITKLMTALVVVEAGQDMDEVLTVTSDDIDREKNTTSRLPIGAKLTRADMLHIALMSSENRAASALGRNYPGGLPAFVAAMNRKARELGMADTHYAEPTGLSSRNVASARDLARLVVAAHAHPLLAKYSTNEKYEIDTGRHTLQYVNSNRLVGNDGWEIELQKTGYIREAGRCLVMHVRIDERPVVMVFLDSKGHLSRFADAQRLRNWVLEQAEVEATAQAGPADEQG